MSNFSGVLPTRWGWRTAAVVLMLLPCVAIAGQATARFRPCQVTDVTDDRYHRNNLFSRRGVMITEVHKGSPAATSGRFGMNLLGKHDVIVEMNGEPTGNLEEFSNVLESVRRDKPEALLVRYHRSCSTGYAGLNLKIGKKGKGDDQ